MDDIRKLDAELNAMVQGGQILPAFERFYGDDVVMQENSEPPVSGKTANRAREQAFVDSVAEVHGIHLLATATAGDVAFGEWLLDVTFKGGGRVIMAQASVRRWKDGKVVAERFYYNKG